MANLVKSSEKKVNSLTTEEKLKHRDAVLKLLEDLPIEHRSKVLSAAYSVIAAYKNSKSK